MRGRVTDRERPGARADRSQTGRSRVFPIGDADRGAPPPLMPAEPPLPTDRDLLVAARTDVAAFATFYDRHEAPLLAFLIRATRNAETAADVAGEVFAVLLREVGRGTAIDEPRGWLYAVARRKVIDGVRRGAVDAAVRRELGIQPVVLTGAAIDRIHELGDDTTVRACEALAELPADQRAAVQARVLDELTYDEIAARLRVSEAVVRKRVSRGLAGLRRRLEEPS